MFSSNPSLTLFSIYAFLYLGSICQAQDYTDYSSPSLPGKLYNPGIPPDSSKIPLILALHGGGGIGNDNTKHLIDFSGLLDYAKANHAALYVPQATTAFWHINDRPQDIIAMIDKAIKEQHVDPDRIYITGFSMGGGGTWDLLKLYPDRFAAAIPIAGINPRITGQIESLAQTPVWAFHARDDSIVSVLQSRRVVDSLIELIDHEAFVYPIASDKETTFDQTIDIPFVRYREYPDGDHFIWWRVYDSNEILDWLFDQKRNRELTSIIVSDIQFLEKTNSFSFEISTNRLSDVSIEKSNDLVTWTPFQLLANVPGNTHFETEESDGFFRAVILTP